MLFRLLWQSFRRRRSRIALAVLAVALGASLATALLAISLDITDKMGRELRTFGANIQVLPKNQGLEVEVAGMRYAAPAVTSYLVSKDEVETGVLLGVAVAERLGLNPGDAMVIGYRGASYPLRVSGIVTSGGFEDEQVLVDLSLAQRIFNLPGKVERVQVSALVKPDDDLAKRAKGNPKALSEADFIKWYCSPYIDAVTYQIAEVIAGSQAWPIRQVAEAKGAFLTRMALTLALVTWVALATAALGVMATMTTTVLERCREIGLMKAIGGENSQIALQFALEAVAYGLLGGLLGYGAGLGLAQFIGLRVFAATISPSAVVLPVTLALAVGVALLGSLPTIRQAMRVDPVVTLRGE